MKKAVAIILVVSMLAAVFCSCAKSGDKSDAVSGGTESVNPESGDASITSESGKTMAELRAGISDGLPDIDFDGKTFTTLVRSGLENQFFSETETADPVETALYRRDRTVSERFNVDIKYVTELGGWQDQGKYISRIRKSVRSSDGEFMLIEGYAAYLTQLASENIFYNWLDFTNTDTSAPWWSAQCTEEMTINGKMFFITGDISLFLWNCIFVIYFNKDIAANYNVGDLYGMVGSGEWTIDRLGEICRKVYADLDNDNAVSAGDLYGMGYARTTNLDASQIMFGAPITKKDDDGFPYLNLDDPRFIVIVEKMNDFMFNNLGVIAPEETVTAYSEMLDKFDDGELLMTSQYLDTAVLLRSMDTNFGILPNPKLDEAQKNYISTPGDPFSLYCVPITVSDTELCSVISEALCAESYRSVIPEYYETALKNKITRDDESQTMLDLIRDTLTFDFGYTVSTSLGSPGPAQVLRVVTNSHSTNFVSQWEQVKSMNTKNLEKMLKAYN